MYIRVECPPSPGGISEEQKESLKRRKIILKEIVALSARCEYLSTYIDKACGAGEDEYYCEIPIDEVNELVEKGQELRDTLQKYYNKLYRVGF